MEKIERIKIVVPQGEEVFIDGKTLRQGEEYYVDKKEVQKEKIIPVDAGEKDK